MNLVRACALGALAVLGTAAASQAGTVINSGPPTAAISYYGETNTASYGQTFTVGADNVLTDFTFYLNHVDGGASKFQFVVMGWDGTKATGPVLFQTGVFSLLNPTLAPITFTTGSLALTTGSQYVGFISTSNEFDGISDNGQMGTPNTNTYTGGEFVFLNNGSNFSRVTLDAWTKNWVGTGGDTSFIANFSSAGDASAAPLPSTAGAGLLLIGGLGMFRARRRLGVC